MILRVGIFVAILIVAVLAFAATKPATFTIQRTRAINVPADKIFSLINDFHNWDKWAPQDKEDSTMRREYLGAESGVGAVSVWDSSGTAGRGRMQITESIPSKRVSILVDFKKPFEAHNVNEFDLEAAGNSTSVTWTMRGTNVYVMKLMNIFVNMDRMMGKHFEAGLDNLKAAAEK